MSLEGVEGGFWGFRIDSRVFQMVKLGVCGGFHGVFQCVSGSFRVLNEIQGHFKGFREVSGVPRALRGFHRASGAFQVVSAAYESVQGDFREFH